eukprot:superscaffoldBa00000007_g146
MGFSRRDFPPKSQSVANGSRCLRSAPFARKRLLAHDHQELDPTSSSQSAQCTQTNAAIAAGGFEDSVYVRGGVMLA